MSDTKRITEEDAYVLGTDDAELRRLARQHETWQAEQRALCELAGLKCGASVLDLGCGPGFTTFDLASFVGPDGKVVALDQSDRFLAFLQGEAQRRGLDNITTSAGAVEELPADEAFDAAYARWLLCWVADPSLVMRRIAGALRPGGMFLLQDYLDWGAMKMLPPCAAFDAVVLACLASWRTSSTIDIAAHIPDLAAAAGLEVTHFRPVARLGAPDSLEWRWISEFLHSYSPRLVETGLLASDDHAAFEAEMKSRASDRRGFLYPPTMTDIVLKKPG